MKLKDILKKLREKEFILHPDEGGWFKINSDALGLEGCIVLDPRVNKRAPCISIDKKEWWNKWHTSTIILPLPKHWQELEVLIDLIDLLSEAEEVEDIEDSKEWMDKMSDYYHLQNLNK